MKKIYITAPYELRKSAQEAMKFFAEIGIECTARWIWQDDSAILSHEWAQADLNDVWLANILVALNPPEWAKNGSGGRHVELGIALTLEKPIYLIGERTNIFHYHDRVTVCATLDEARDMISKLGE